MTVNRPKGRGRVNITSSANGREGIVITPMLYEPPQSATMVSVRGGKQQVHDGPYAETKEFLGGFVIIDVPDLDAALEWAARNPAAAYSAVEVRPLFAYS